MGPGEKEEEMGKSKKVCDRCGDDLGPDPYLIVKDADDNDEGWCESCWEYRAEKCANCHRWYDSSRAKCPRCGADASGLHGQFVVHEAESYRQYLQRIVAEEGVPTSRLTAQERKVLSGELVLPRRKGGA